MLGVGDTKCGIYKPKWGIYTPWVIRRGTLVHSLGSMNLSLMILLPQFVKQMGPSAYDAYAVAVGCIFLEECFAYAGGGSNDNNGLLFHFVVFIFLRNCYYYLAAQKDTV